MTDMAARDGTFNQASLPQAAWTAAEIAEAGSDDCGAPVASADTASNAGTGSDVTNEEGATTAVTMHGSSSSSDEEMLSDCSSVADHFEAPPAAADWAAAAEELQAAQGYDTPTPCALVSGPSGMAAAAEGAPPPAPSESPLLPPQEGPPRKTLVLDLDQTLIECLHLWFDAPNAPDFIYTDCEGCMAKVWQRPHLRYFLEEAAKHFEVVLFTAAAQRHADAVLAVVDPSRTLVHHRLYGHHTVPTPAWGWVKDLSRLGRDLAHTLIVDDCAGAALLQPGNWLSIRPFSHADIAWDTALLQVLQFLMEKVLPADDVRVALNELHLQQALQAQLHAVMVQMQAQQQCDDDAIAGATPEGQPSALPAICDTAAQQLPASEGDAAGLGSCGTCVLIPNTCSADVASSGDETAMVLSGAPSSCDGTIMVEGLPGMDTVPEVMACLPPALPTVV